MSPALRVRSTLPVLLVLLTASAAGAQEPRACFRPAPADRCTSFWVTEFGVTAIVAQPDRLADTIPGTGEFPPYVFLSERPTALVTWELGRMWNLGGRALGGTLFAGLAWGDEDQNRWGIRARHRWWLGRGGAVDLGPGIVILNRPTRGAQYFTYRRVPGVTLQGSYSPREWIGAVAAAELSGDGFGAQLGGRLGSTPGGVVGLALPVAALVALLSFVED